MNRGVAARKRDHPEVKTGTTRGLVMTSRVRNAVSPKRSSPQEEFALRKGEGGRRPYAKNP